MLVMSVKEGDYILIGDSVKVYFNHKVYDSSLAIAVDAPPGMDILRGKLYEKQNPDAPKRTRIKYGRRKAG